MIDRRQGRAVLLAAVVIGAVLAGGMGTGAATTPVIDSETATTTTTSQIQDDDTVNITAGHNDTLTVQVNVTPDDMGDVGLNVSVNASGYEAAQNESPTNVSAAGSTNQGAHYNVSIAESAIVDLERSLNENVSTTWHVYDADNESDGSNETAISVHLDFDDGWTVERVGSTSDDVVTFKNDSGQFGIGLLGGEDESRITVEDRNWSSSGAVVLVATDSAIVDDFEAASSEASDATKISGLMSGTRTAVLVSTDERTVAAPVFVNEVPDDFDTSRTYAIQSTDIGGETGVKVYPGDDFDDGNKITVTAVGSAGWTTFATQYLMAASPLGVLSFDLGSLTAVTPFVVFAGRRRDPPNGGASAELTSMADARRPAEA